MQPCEPNCVARHCPPQCNLLSGREASAAAPAGSPSGLCLHMSEGNDYCLLVFAKCVHVCRGVGHCLSTLSPTFGEK
ncbi:unnamed protein product [Protopolystoma xenopodis]|uniref:Uncharacterized protein n=1 Tax=Protopolystoma xenopodis TaxID=117903 RepID=A0A3S5CV10_9PLAT|nr:unnamed protein product [Protopolystoma xenopodis]